MTQKKRRTRRVSLPRPRRTSSRAELVIVMHPAELDELIERARDRSMSLTAYVVSLLASDEEDIPAADPRQLSLLAAPERPRVCFLCGRPATSTLRGRYFCTECLPREPAPEPPEDRAELVRARLGL